MDVAGVETQKYTGIAERHFRARLDTEEIDISALRCNLPLAMASQTNQERNIMIIHKLHLVTKLDVWTPKYNDKSLTQDYDEYVALVHVGKVAKSSPVIIVNFPKAKHLAGQRFCIRKQDAQKHAVGSNGKAPMYEIPMSHFESWQTAEEVRDIAFSLFDN